jgi:hypothetical protein
MSEPVKLYDVVALLEPIPEEKLLRGHVGIVIEELAPNVFEVEFSDHRNGITYAMLPLRAEQFMVLHYEPASN